MSSAFGDTSLVTPISGMTCLVLHYANYIHIIGKHLSFLHKEASLCSRRISKRLITLIKRLTSK